MKNALYVIAAIVILFVGAVSVSYLSVYLKKSVADPAVEKVVQNYFSAVQAGDASSSTLYLTSSLQTADPNLYTEDVAMFGSIKTVAPKTAGVYSVSPLGAETYTYNAEITSSGENKVDAVINLVKQDGNWYINSITASQVVSPFGQ